MEWLKAAYGRVKPDSAPGVDGQSWADYGKDLEKNLLSLLNRIKSGSYVAPPVKRVNIPKGDGKETRPIGMSTIEDKVLQRLMPFGQPKGETEDSRGEGTPPDTFDFLGFTHYWGKARKGGWVIRRRTMRKRLTRSLKVISQWCWKNLHEPLRVQVEALGRKLKGHFGYYGIIGNYDALARYRQEVIRIWRKWLARRGDPQGMPWERMNRLLQFYYLPPARIVHSVCAVKP